MKQNIVTMICLNNIEELTVDEKADIYNLLFDPYDCGDHLVHDTAVSYCVGGIEEDERVFYEKNEVAAFEHLDNLLAAAGIERGHEVWLK